MSGMQFYGKKVCFIGAHPDDIELGCGALIARCIRKAEVVAYEDLGAEAIYRLEVENLPVTVIIDSLGNDLYQTGPADYFASKV